MTAASTPADTLIEALGLTQRSTAEVQDLYSRPIGAEVLLFKPRNREGAPGREAA